MIPQAEIISLYEKFLSAPEISQKLHISLNTIYRTLKKGNIPRRAPAFQNAIRFERKPLTFAIKEPRTLKEEKLFVSGLMLYLGEGAKTGKTVDFANSDSRLIKLFLVFLREIFRIDESKLRFYLYCFSNQTPSHLIDFWVHHLDVKKEQFTKPYVRESKKITSAKTRIMSWGVLHVRYNDKRLLEKILSLCSTLVAEIDH